MRPLGFPIAEPAIALVVRHPLFGDEILIQGDGEGSIRIALRPARLTRDQALDQALDCFHARLTAQLRREVKSNV